MGRCFFCLVVLLTACSDAPKGVCVRETTCTGNYQEKACVSISGTWHEYATADEKKESPTSPTVGKQTCRGLGFTDFTGDRMYHKALR